MTQESHIITIEKIVPTGFGLGHFADGRVVLVRYALPGERVRVRPTRIKKQYVEAELEDILTPSHARREPICRLYGKCGGCDLQHADETSQQHLKLEMLEENLNRGGLHRDILKKILQPMLPSSRQTGYRQRIRLHIDRMGRPGFRRPQSHDIEPAASCPLAVLEINSVLGHLQQASTAGQLLKLADSMELLFHPETGEVFILLHYQRRPRPADSHLAATLAAEIPGIGQILFQTKGHGFFGPGNRYRTATLPPQLTMRLPPEITGVCDLTLSWEAGGFCQVNTEQNLAMIKYIMDLGQSAPQSRILDLYCGMGNFSLPLSLQGGRVLGLDSQGSGIRSARGNVARNRERLNLRRDQPPLHCRFEKTSVPAGVDKLIRSGSRFDLILLDPPRRGAAEIISTLPALGAPSLIYVSCDAATLARDFSRLAEVGYHPCRLQPIDMFPQTHHLETVTLFVKKETSLPDS
jgi:23S rRNA (uracil1939-C5)-methyltransferase